MSELDGATPGSFSWEAARPPPLAGFKINFPTRIELLVCKQKLPEVEGSKSVQDPIAYEWPRQIVEDNNMEIDYEWYRNMVYSYLETIFDFPSGSLKMNLKSLFGEFQEQPPAPIGEWLPPIQHLTISIKEGFFDTFTSDDVEEPFVINKGFDWDDFPEDTSNYAFTNIPDTSVKPLTINDIDVWNKFEPDENPFKFEEHKKVWRKIDD
jgi:hypothetical protein